MSVDSPVADAAAATAVLLAGLIDQIRVLEEVKASAAAAQARAAALFDAVTRSVQAEGGMRPEQLGKGVGAQVGLARRESPHRGTRLLGLARILTREMPHTLHALTTGVISEWRATLLVRETACLTLADRQKVDEQVAGNLAELEQLGDWQLIARIKMVSYGLDPRSVVNRASKAASERFVSCRPAPDTMTYVTALLPVAQGVGVYAALTREADRLRAAGDARSKGQIMADTFVERTTGKVRAEDVRVEVQLIMTDRALLGGSSEPAVLAGYGVVPAQLARNLVRGRDKGPECNSDKDEDSYRGLGTRTSARSGAAAVTGWGAPPAPPAPPPRPDPRTEVWVRRLYTAPDTGALVGMDSRARLVPKGLARFIAARDQVCRMPWCGAPIRHYDHITPVHDGGPTSADNIQGLCEACNQAKEAPGWSMSTEPVVPRLNVAAEGRSATAAQTRTHTVQLRTPTGHTYRSSAPPAPGGG
ncbi:hypothetical protein ABIB35_003329 [Arthrobacter sp. UYP6]|uniref:HNH endonuclease n=1 Tax=Arthrobacter sp. UYP6 TaxID=1756378 RepID=UPI00339A5895